MGLIFGGSLAFSIGVAFMKPSAGLTRMYPTLIVVLSFVIGAAFLTRAVTIATTTTTVIIGLGLEATLTLAIGTLLLGDRINIRQVLGVVLVLAGVALVR
jgi:multidrug transporter EmrE-like cation transporter